jgi:hypothetical protein
MGEKCKDNKVVFRLHASKKDIQYNGQKKKDKSKEYTKHYTEY